MADRKLWFVHFAQWASHITGRPLTFMLALASIVVWAMLGPFFGFSDTWQLVINTATTIITFLMVFVIQNTQNRDTAAMHIKIDELIRVTQKARNVLLILRSSTTRRSICCARTTRSSPARRSRTRARRSAPRRCPAARDDRRRARARPQMIETRKVDSIGEGASRSRVIPSASTNTSRSKMKAAAPQCCSTARRCARQAKRPSSCRTRRWRKRSPRNGAGRERASSLRPCR